MNNALSHRGMSPDSENLRFATVKYYAEMMLGKNF